MHTTLTPALQGTIAPLAARASRSQRLQRRLTVLGAVLALLLCSAPATTFAQTGFTNFGSINIASTSTAIPVVLTFGTAGTLGSTVVYTQDATGLDFADAGGDSCVLGVAYVSGATCTVNVTFTPKFSGVRNGAVVLGDGNGNTFATGLVQGTGIGPQINFLPGSQTTLGSGFLNPQGVAVDGSGNVYVADFYNNAVYEIMAVSGVIPDSPTIRTLGSGFGGPRDLAVDSSGDVYVADSSSGDVKEILAANGSIPASPTILIIGPHFNFSTGTGFNDPMGVAVDSNGNVFVTDGNEAAAGAQPSVYEILAVNGSVPASPVIQTLYTGTIHPTGIALDNNGNVYLADNFINAVYEILAVNDSIPASPTLVTLGDGFNAPTGVAVDGNGNLYVGDTGNGAVKELLAVNGSIPASPLIETIASSFGQPAGLAVDASGNVFVADGINHSSGITYGVAKLDFADAPSLSFASTATGFTSTDSPQTVIIANAGNAALNFSGVSYPADFPAAAGDANACTGSTSLIAGAVCDLPIDFTPQSIGSLSENVTLTDNAPNMSGAQQKIAVSGIAIRNTQAITFSAIVEPVYAVSSIALSATATSSLAVSITSTTPSVCTVSETGGTWTAQLLIGGNCTLIATQKGNSAWFPAAPITRTFTVNRVPQTITFPPIAEPVYVGGTVSPAATATSGLAVSSYVAVHPGVCAVSQVAGVWTINLIAVGECSVEAQQAGNKVYQGAPFAFQNFYVHPVR